MVQPGVQLNILLPVCIEVKVDVFLDIFKKSVARSKINDNNITNAFISGMNGKCFEIESDDLKLNWTQLSSEAQKIRQAKLLGFWTIDKFPSLGRKLFGDSYQSSQRNTLKVIGNSEIQAETIDDFMFPKMKLRVIQLRVCGSTIRKLKHFIKVPACVAKNDSELGISTKMSSFDIKAVYVESCWEALKVGEFAMNLDNEHQVYETVMHPCTVSISEIDTGENSQTFPPSKRQCRRRSSKTASITNEYVNDAVSKIDLLMVPPPKTSCQEMDNSYERDHGSQMFVGTMNEEDTFDDSNIGSLRKIILQMRKDISSLTKQVQDTGSDRLHVMRMKEKDDEIARIRASEKELQRANEELISSQTNSQQKIEEQATLIAALQKGVEAISILYANSKVELNASLDLIKTFKGEKEKEEEIALIKASEKELLQANEGLISSQTNLQQQIDDQAALIVSLQKGVDASSCLYAKSKVELEVSLDLMKTIRSEMATKFVEIEEFQDLDRRFNCAKEELHDIKCYATTKEKQLIAANAQISASSMLGDDLAALKAKSISIVSELNSQIVSLEKINEESIQRNNQLEKELNEMCADRKSKELEHRSRSDMETQTEMVGEPSGNVSSGDITTENILNEDKSSKSDSELEFETDDPVVKLYRKKLQYLRFGWMKFNLKKNAKFYPGLVWPPDNDGIERAQRIDATTGYPSDEKNQFFEFSVDIRENLKKQAEKYALNKFNEKFNSSYQ